MTPASVRLCWEQLFESGSVIDLDTAIWTAKVGIEESDFGTDSPEVRKVMALGTHRLIPKDAFTELRELRGEAKRAIENASMTFPFVKGARFTPAPKVDALIATLRDIQRRFMEAAVRFKKVYGEKRKEQEPHIKKALQDIARTPDAAESAYRRLMAEYPPEDAILRKFYMRWTVYAIQAPKVSAAAQTMKEETETVKAVVKEMILQLRDEVMERVAALTRILSGGGTVSSTTVTATREVLARVRDMNVFGDAELEAAVGNLSRLLTTLEADGKDAKVVDGVVGELDAVMLGIKKSEEQAMKDAVATLTGVGRRKIMARKEVA